MVYAASGCTLAPHTWDDAAPVVEDGPVPLDLDSPYQISKVVGEFYSVYYFNRHGLPTVRARFQNVYGPGEILGAGEWRGTPHTVWRNVTPTFVYRALQGLPLNSTTGAWRRATSSSSRDIVRGLILCATAGAPGDVYNLASGADDDDPRAGGDDRRACGDGGEARDRSGTRLGSFRPTGREHREGSA